jgi:hypothetical protein
VEYQYRAGVSRRKEKLVLEFRRWLLRKLFLLIVVVFIVLVVVYRQRIFLRDPLATLTRDGVQEMGAQIYINYSNDVLIENDIPPAYALVIQHGQHVGSPKRLQCIHWMACMTDADVATLAEPLNVLVTDMTGKLVQFTDPKGHDVRVTLR